MSTYKSIIDNEEFSKISAMKKILGYTDAEIEQNFKNLIKEKCLVELAEYWSGKVNSEGPAGEYDKPPIPIKGYSDKEETASADEAGDEEAAADEEPSDKGADEKPEAPEAKEAPAATFGLGD